MLLQPERDKLIEEMFQAAMKEKFSQFARKYDPKIVFEIWTETVGRRGMNRYFQKCGWKPEMTIQEALDGLDHCCELIEALIRERVENGCKRES